MTLREKKCIIYYITTARKDPNMTTLYMLTSQSKVQMMSFIIISNDHLIVIDGGFCRAYQSYTGIAGYTMFFSSHGIRIAAHQPFGSRDEAIRLGKDITSTTILSENLPDRLYVGETDTGRALKNKISELQALLAAYRMGIIPEAEKR